MNDRAARLPPKPRWYAVTTAVLALFIVTYVGGYGVARATRQVVHVHWGGLGRYGCSHLEPTGRGRWVWRPLIAAETRARITLDDGWGLCPEVTE